MALSFVDIESTGLHAQCRPWEIAVIRRESDGTEREFCLYVKVEDLDLPRAQPLGLAIGRFSQRHPQRGGRLPAGALLTGEKEAAKHFTEWTAGTVIHGVYPAYDVEVLTKMLSRHGITPRWSPVTPVDVARKARKWLKAQGIAPVKENAAVSRQCGIEIPGNDDFHTALGDARWARRWFDHLESEAAVRK